MISLLNLPWLICVSKYIDQQSLQNEWLHEILKYRFADCIVAQTKHCFSLFLTIDQSLGDDNDNDVEDVDDDDGEDSVFGELGLILALT